MFVKLIFIFKVAPGTIDKRIIMHHFIKTRCEDLTQRTNLDRVFGLIARCFVGRGQRPNGRNAVDIVANPRVGRRRRRRDEAGVQVLQLHIPMESHNSR